MRDAYYEPGSRQMVTVLTRGRSRGGELFPGVPCRRSLMNVLLQRPDGTKVVRPFRGLRKPEEVTTNG